MLDDVRYRAGVPSLLILAFFALGLTIGKIVDSDPPNTVNNSEARQATAEIGAPVAPLKAISSDDRIANYTESLAWLTAGLVGVAIFQIWLLVRAESVSSKSASAALAAVDLARDEFNATHRPRIRVRSIIGAREFLADSEELRPLITLANIGDTEATITHVFCRNGIKRDVEVVRMENILSQANIHAYSLHPGGGSAAKGVRAIEIPADGIPMILGSIHYTDAAGWIYQTVFGWDYNPQSHSCRKPKEEDQDNYED